MTIPVVFSVFFFIIIMLFILGSVLAVGSVFAAAAIYLKRRLERLIFRLAERTALATPWTLAAAAKQPEPSPYFPFACTSSLLFIIFLEIGRPQISTSLREFAIGTSDLFFLKVLASL